MITAQHAQMLGQALAQLLGDPAQGSLAFLRCLPSVIVDTLASHADFVVPGYAVYGVVDKAEETRALVTADRAVELREDKDDPVLLLIDFQRAGAGLDGIYSAGREIGERELFAQANDLARRTLPRGFMSFTRSAVRAARQIGQRSFVSPWQEFEFLVGAGPSIQAAGSAVTQLGLWPIACERTPSPTDLELSRTLVNRLLLNRELSLTPNAKVAALLLDDPGGEQKQELERFIRDTADVDFRRAVVQLLDHPRLWLHNLQPHFTSEKLQQLDLVSWRNKQHKIHKWSGLGLETGEETPKFVIDRAAIGQPRSPQLEVRWTTKPADLAKGAVEYQAVVMSGDETLAVRTVAHKPKGPQKVAFSFEDFEELDENARFEAFVRLSAVGLPEVQSQDTEQFLLEFGQYEGISSSSSGPVVRCFVEGAIECATRAEFDAAVKDFHLRATEDKKGYLAWRAGSGRSVRVLRPALIREIEHNWTSAGGAPGRWSVRVRADGSRSEAVVFQAIEQGQCADAVWERLNTANRRLCEEAARGPGLLAWVQASRWPVVEEYLRAWTEAIDQGAPEVCLAHTVEVRSLAGQTLGLIVLPSHPLRLAWHAAYDQLAVQARFEQGMSAGAVKDMLHALDSAHFPFVLPGLLPNHGFIFGDTLGFHAVAMVPDNDREPKAAISIMAACLADGRPEAVPSVGRQSAQVLAREIGHYLDCHGHGQQESRRDLDLLHVYAYNPGDGMTVSRALGDALQTRPAHAEESEDDDEARDLCFVLDIFPFDEQSSIFSFR